MSVGNDVVDLADPETLREKQHPRFDERVYAPDELAFLRRGDAEHLARWLLWAAKEAAYKAQKREAPDTVFSPRRFIVDLPPVAEAAGAEQGSVRFDERLFSLTVEWTRDFVHAVAMDEVMRAGRSVAEVARAAGGSSRTARELAARGVGRLLGIGHRRLEIDGRPPQVRHQGVVVVKDVSLSHHGRFIAFAAVVPRDRLLRDSE